MTNTAQTFIDDDDAELLALIEAEGEDCTEDLADEDYRRSLFLGEDI